MTGGAKSRAESAFAVDVDWQEDDGEAPPAWMLRRQQLGGDLESEFKHPPFETYKLYRGKAMGMLG